MGVTWSMEIISFLISPQSNFFLLTDICNTIQGVLIFVLFVMKRRVMRLIKKRFVYTSCYWCAITTAFASPLPCDLFNWLWLFLDGNFALAKRLQMEVSQRIVHRPLMLRQILFWIRLHLQMINQKRIIEHSRVAFNFDAIWQIVSA